MVASATNFRNKDMQTVVTLRRSALQNSAHTNIYNEAYTLGLACHPKSHPNKNENVQKITEGRKAASLIQVALSFALV
jgi:hypothetical protein